MKKIFFLWGFLSVFVLVNAQSDSLNDYQRQLAVISKAYRDSLQHDFRFRDLVDKIRAARAASDNYGSFVLYTQISSADFKKLNADNATSGFGPLSGSMFSVGYGLSFKKNRRIFDLNLTAFGVSKQTKKNDERINTSLSTFLEFNWGYDFIKSKTINLYPFLGFGFRNAMLEYKAQNVLSPSPTNITNIVQTNRSVRDEMLQLAYQAGIGFEIVLTKPDRPGGTIFFVKGGTSRPFSNRDYNFDGFRYDAQLHYGDWMAVVGFKFFGR